MRAAAVFESLRDAFPSSPVADRAAYSAGLALLRAAQDGPLRRGTRVRGYRGEVPDYLRAGVDAFERCARDYPFGPLARDAAEAAGYWRRARPRLWEPGD